MATFIDPSLVPLLSTFLFVFAVVFGLLTMKRKGDGLFNEKVNAIIALVFAAFSASYEPLVSGLQQFIPLASVALIGLFLLVFLKRAIEGKDSGKDKLPFMFVIAVLLASLAFLWDAIGFSAFGLSSSNMLWIIGIVLVIIIIYAAYKTPPPTRER